MDALLLFSPGGGAASSQNPPLLILLLLLPTAELHGAGDTRLEDPPGWTCLCLFWGVDNAGLEVFDGGVPTVAALLAQDKLELALPQTEAYKTISLNKSVEIFYLSLNAIFCKLNVEQ